MKFIRTPTAAASLPALSDTGTEGYFQDGDPGTGTPATKFDAAWCNGVQGEIGAIVTEVGGVSRSGTTLNQAATALGGARGLKAHATDTGVVSTLNTRVVIASNTSRAHGNGANVIVGSVNAEAEGSRTVILASQTSTADLIASSTAVNALIAAADDCQVTGTDCAVIAADLSDVDGVNCASMATKGGDITGTSTECVVLAAEDSTLDDSAQCAILASENVTGANGINSAAIAAAGGTVNGSHAATLATESCGADGTAAATLASYDAETDGDMCSSVGCHSTNVGNTRTNAVLVGSKNAELGHSFALAMGYHASVKPTFSDSSQNLTFRVDGTTGNIYCDGTAGAGAADFAELFENETIGALPVGTLVARTGRKVRVALPGDRVAGVVSADPMLLGNSGQSWAGRYARDEFGSKITEVHEYVKWPALYEPREVTEVVTETRKVQSQIVAVNGAPLFVDEPYDVERKRTIKVKVRDAYDGLAFQAPAPFPADARCYTVDAPKPSEAYEPGRQHIARTARPEEWTPVALVGQVRVRIGDGVTVGAFLSPGANGCAVARPGAGTGRPVEVMEITTPYDAARGYGVALCLVG